MVVKIGIFSIAALWVVVKLGPQLRSARHHGFYMFFVFQSLLVLLFFNVDFWFHGAVSWTQMLSWLLLTASGLVAISGFYGMKRHGKAAGDWEATTQLIKIGIFKWIRHPLYSSLMLLSTGILLKHVTATTLSAWLVCMTGLVAASLAEEKENLDKFGDAYDRYMRQSRRYIPFIL